MGNETNDITFIKKWKLFFLIGILIIACGFGLKAQQIIQSQPEKKPDVIVSTEKPEKKPDVIVKLAGPSLRDRMIVNTEKSETRTLVSLIVKLQPQIEPLVAEYISNSVLKYSEKFNLPSELVLSVIKEESRFRILITSKKGASGLMQIMPKAHPDKLKELKITRNELYHIDHNIHVGCWVLREYYDKTKSVEKALYKYVGGNTQNSNKYVSNILVSVATILIDGKMINK